MRKRFQDRPAKVLLAMPPGVADEVFSDGSRRRLRALAPMCAPDEPGGPLHCADRLNGDTPGLAEAEVLITGWGTPRLDAELLDAAPRLRAVLHAAGTVKPLVTKEVFARGIRVSSAAAANAVPVAEFAFASIVLGAKRAFTTAHRYRTGPVKRNLDGLPWIGTLGRTVGVVGASRTGRRLLALLRDHLDVELLVHDPYLEPDEAAALGAEHVPDLDALVRRSEVLSLHAPALPATRRLLDARRLALLPDGAVVVNTARGSLVDTEALTAECASGRLDAVLDVTDPEPLPPGHPLFELPNVLLTPHLAGALGSESERLGEAALDELARYADGLPLRHEVRAEDWDRIA